MKEPKTSFSEDLKVLRQECVDLKEENSKLKDDIAQTSNKLCISEQELIDTKKTISKMQQEHEAEVQDLKDKLDEARADAAVAEKNHAHAVGEKNDYADALDDDSIAFEEILGLAILMERGAKSMHEVSKMIQAKTEGRV